MNKDRSVMDLRVLFRFSSFLPVHKSPDRLSNKKKMRAFVNFFNVLLIGVQETLVGVK